MYTFLQEHLYDDDIQGKVAAASQIATLFRQTTQLQSLLAEAALLPTLARILRDDGRRRSVGPAA